MNYRALLVWLAIIFYVASPFDFLPDVFGPYGRIDDLLVLLFGLWWLKKVLPQSPEPDSPCSPTDRDQNSPWSVLEIPEGASQEEVKAAYHRLSSQYHPDKVQHLGKDLQEVANQKFIQINQAYEELKKSQSS